ncbi:autotransporter-associated beta strand repeat-containing protein [Luteolibacter sp.]|uniref:beta strand repeat-containing protein n=1 Tax=Luteolibacter sp. TaxID=1962973 RepID=UPI0032674E20
MKSKRFPFSIAATTFVMALSVASSIHAASLTWDADAIFNGTFGGTGPWNTSTLNWSNASADQAWTTNTITGDTGLFAGTSGTVTLGSAINALGLQFTTTGYTVATGANTLSLGTGGIDASALSSGTTTLTGLVALGANQSWNVGSGATLTSTALISGTGFGITKSGAGTLTFNANNTYSGSTVINAGTLSLGSTGAGPYTIANSDVTVNAGGTFTFGADTDTRNITTTIAKSLTLNGGTAKLVGTFRSPTDVFTNDLTLASGSSLLAVDGATNGGFGSAVRFSGTLTRTAGATVLFRGRNLGGSTNIDANNTGQPQNIYFTTAPTVVGGGGSLASTTTSILPYAIGDNGYLQGTTNLTSGLGTDFVSYNPTGGTGAGVQLLTTYANTITSGVSALNNVKITDTSATGINAATTINSLILNSATAASGSPGTTGVDGTGTLTINSGALMVTTTSAAASNGGTGGNYGGLFQNNATIGASGLTLDFGSREAIITTVGSSTLTIASTSGGITGSGGLTKSGAGTLTLSAASTYSGGTTVNAGTLVIGSSSTPTSGTVTSGPVGTGAITLAGGTLGMAGGNFTVANNINVTASSIIQSGNSFNPVLSGNITGSGNLRQSPTGFTGRLQLSGNNSGYTGTFTEDGGNTSLEFLSASAGSASAAWVFNNTIAQRTRFNFGTDTINLGSLSGSGDLANIAASGTTATLSVGALNTDTTFSGVLAANGTSHLALTKVGTGKLTLSNANTYTGKTTIGGGSLTLASTGSIANSSEISINGGNFNVSAVSGFSLGSAQSLTGSGGSVTGAINVNGTLAIGNSPGTMTFNNDLTFGSSAASNFEFTNITLGINSYDLAQGGAGSQAVTFGGTLNLLFSGGTYANGGSVQIFNFDTYGGTFATVNFSGLDVGQSAVFDTATGYVTVVPEPGAALMGGLGPLVLLRRRRC